MNICTFFTWFSGVFTRSHFSNIVNHSLKVLKEFFYAGGWNGTSLPVGDTK